MATNETGLEKTAAHFEELILRCQRLGIDYNPPKASMQVSSMLVQLSDCRNAIAAVITARINLNMAINQRRVFYIALPALVTRIIGTLVVCGASRSTVEDARGIQRNISGKRAGKKAASSNAADGRTASGTGDAGTETITRSVSHRSYEQQLGYFNQLIALVSAEPVYAPNETDLQVSTLTALHASMSAANTAVLHAAADHKSALVARNDAMYKQFSGLVYIGQQVKTYVRVLFGSASEQYQGIARLSFH